MDITMIGGGRRENAKTVSEEGILPVMNQPATTPGCLREGPVKEDWPGAMRIHLDPAMSTPLCACGSMPNKVHIRPVADTPPADNSMQMGEQELIPPHMRSKSNSPVPSGSRGTPNSYVVADTPPRPGTASRGSCRPPIFNIRSVFDSDSDEEGGGEEDPCPHFVSGCRRPKMAQYQNSNFPCQFKLCHKT